MEPHGSGPPCCRIHGYVREHNPGQCMCIMFSCVSLCVCASLFLCVTVGISIQVGVARLSHLQHATRRYALPAASSMLRLPCIATLCAKVACRAPVHRRVLSDRAATRRPTGHQPTLARFLFSILLEILGRSYSADPSQPC